MLSGHIKSVLSMLLLVLVFAVSSQAAVCEIACGLEARSMACGTSDPPHEAMQMPKGHCGPATHAQSRARMADGSALMMNVAGAQEAGCHHAFAPVIGPVVDGHRASTEWPIAAVMPAVVRNGRQGTQVRLRTVGHRSAAVPSLTPLRI